MSPNQLTSKTVLAADKTESIGEYLLREGLGRPDHAAVIRMEDSWSYRELANRTEALAMDLASRGIRRGDVVIVVSEPVPSALVVVLACWAIGVIYVPIAPKTPIRRRDRIIAMTDPVALATDGQVDSTSTTQVLVHIGQGEITVTGTADRRKRSEAGREAPLDSAYVIFTSGTTGTPKGITMTHRAARAFFDGMAQQVPIPSDARIGSVAPLSFDLSLLDWGLVGKAGATLVQVPRQLLYPPRRFVEYLQQHEVSMVSAVPSVWRPVLRHASDELAKCTSLSAVLLTGEPYPIDLVQTLRQARPGLRIINAYGQSESIACSFLELPDPLPPNLAHIPIGPAHPGAEMIVVNGQGQPAEPGEAGEMFLRSTALFSGYWRDPETTDRVLVPPPDAPDSPERVLRSGDRLRCEADGTFSFAGRVDHQVKVNGNRVELEEIERVLGTHPAVAEVVTTVIQDTSGDQLVAVVVAHTPTENTPQQLRTVCRTQLPPYMVPTDIVLAPSLPHNESGKIDRHRTHQVAINALHPTMQTEP